MKVLHGSERLLLTVGLVCVLVYVCTRIYATAMYQAGVGVLELYVARYSRENVKDRAFLVLAAIASISVGVGVMIWAFIGAVVISATVGIAASV